MEECGQKKPELEKILDMTVNIGVFFVVGNYLRNSAQNYSPTVKLTELTIAGKD